MIRSERLGPWLAAGLFIVSFALFALAGLYTLRQQHRVDDQICRSAVTNRDATRTAWLAAERFIIRGQPEEARENTRLFFREVLSEIPSLRCVDRKPMEVR